MKIRYLLFIALAMLTLLSFSDDELDFDPLDAVADRVQNAPLVKTAIGDRPIDPNSYTIEVHPKNEIRILASKRVEGGYELRIFSSAPFVKYDDRVFHFREPGEARFLVPDDRKKRVKML